MRSLAVSRGPREAHAVAECGRRLPAFSVAPLLMVSCSVVLLPEAFISAWCRQRSVPSGSRILPLKWPPPLNVSVSAVGAAVGDMPAAVSSTDGFALALRSSVAVVSVD